jgi:hypothetical protein
MPGQWSPVHVPGSAYQPGLYATSGITCFTTFRKLAPTITNITALLNATYRAVQKYTRRQQIRAEPVLRSDGSRKKILLDAGHAEEPVTPKNLSYAQRQSIYPQRESANRDMFGRHLSTVVIYNPPPLVPGAWPTSPNPPSLWIDKGESDGTAQHILSSEMPSQMDWMSHAIPREQSQYHDYAPHASATPDYSSASPAPSIETTPSRVGHAVRALSNVLSFQKTAIENSTPTATTARDYTPTIYYEVPDEEEYIHHSPPTSASVRESVAITPQLGNDESEDSFWNADDVTTGTPSQSPCERTKPSAMISEQAKPSSKSPSQNGRVPATHKPALHRNVLRTMSSGKSLGSNHTNLRQRNPALSRSPLQKAACPPPRAYYMQVQSTSAQANIENAANKAKREAALKNKKEREEREAAQKMAQLESYEKNHPRIHFSGFDESSLPLEASIGNTSEYDNDESFLPDALTAAPEKGVVWGKDSRVKRFTYNSRVDEMLDSSIESIKFTPKKIVEDAPKGAPKDVPKKALPQSAQKTVPPPQPTVTDDVSSDTGVRSEASEDSDDSLEQSIMSTQMLENLRVFSEQITLSPKVEQPPPPSPPLPPPVKVLVSPLDTTEEDKLAKAVQDANAGRAEVTKKLSTHDFKTLLPDMFAGHSLWLNDNIVNEYLDLLVKHLQEEAGWKKTKDGPAPPVFAFPSQWWTTVYTPEDTQDPIKLNKVATWARRRRLGGKQFLDAKLILLPICHKSHWRLVAIKPQERSVEYLDSLGWEGGIIVDITMQWIKQELGPLFIDREWSVAGGQASVRQLNGSDCGVFACMNALTLLRGEESKRVVSVEGMMDARKRIAVSLLKEAVTAEFA